MPFKINQTAFRGRNDDNNEASATWKANQNLGWTQPVDSNFRVRFLLDESGGVAWTNKTFNLYFSYNGSVYAAVGAGAAVILSPSGNFAQGADCTTQMTGGTGTFVTDNNGMCESAGATNSGTAGQYFDMECCVQIVGGSVVHGGTVNLRVYDGTGAINSYAFTPAIVVSKPATLVAANLDASTPALDAPALLQNHALVAMGMGAGTPTLDAPVLQQAAPGVELTPEGIASGAPVFDAPAILQGHALTPAVLDSSAPTCGAPSIAQQHALSAAGFGTGSPEVGAVSLGQVYALAASDITTPAPVFDAPTLTEIVSQAGVDALTAVGLAADAPTLGAPSIAQVHALATGELFGGAPSLAEVLFSQCHVLTCAALNVSAANLGAPALAYRSAKTWGQTAHQVKAGTSADYNTPQQRNVETKKRDDIAPDKRKPIEAD